MDKATKRHFFTHGKDDADLSEREACHWCQLRSFATHSSIPITVVNEVSEHVLPQDFRFINSMVLGDGVEPAEDSFRSGCSCDTDESCQFTDCLCLADLADDGDLEMDGQGSGGRRKAYAYHAHGAKAGLLRSRLHHSTVPLYECHQGCACSNDCPNRVVERGRTVPLQIFRTKDRGWGVRAQAAIQCGQFVDRYLGEIITAEEADRRRANSAVSQRKDVYLFALDKFTDPDSLDPRLNGPPLEVDGEFMSGPTRFINHSCDPNLRIFARVGDHADKHIHDLALFAIKDIAQGEELTFDYVDGVTEDTDEADGNVEGMTKSMPSEPLRTFKRRNGQHECRRKLQHARGRPSSGEKRCDNGPCRKACCSYDEPPTVMRAKEINEYGVSIERIYTQFLSTATRLMWPTQQHRGLLFTKYHLAESFITSPPVHAAYWTFINLTRQAGIAIDSEGELRGRILSTLPTFQKAMFDRHRICDVHRYLDTATGSTVRASLDLGDFVLKYLVSVELWRRREVVQGRDWTFQDDESTCAFVASTLLQLWVMDKEGCFEAHEEDATGTGWYVVWEDWLDRYPRMEIDATDAVFAQKQFGLPDELVMSQVGYIGGMGRRPPGWLQK